MGISFKKIRTRKVKQSLLLVGLNLSFSYPRQDMHLVNAHLGEKMLTFIYQ